MSSFEKFQEEIDLSQAIGIAPPESTMSCDVSTAYQYDPQELLINWYHYANSFLDSARIICYSMSNQAILLEIKPSISDESPIFASLFSIRHSLEVFLKYLSLASTILYSSVNSEVEKSIVKEHNLKDLFKKVQIKNFRSHPLEEEVKNLEPYIAYFNKIDPFGFSLRYPLLPEEAFTK